MEVLLLGAQGDAVSLQAALRTAPRPASCVRRGCCVSPRATITPATPQTPTTMDARPPTNEELEKKWTEWTDAWEEHYEPITLPVTQTLLTWSNLRSATSILEVACGTGAGTQLCNVQKAQRARLTSVDLSSTMVARAKLKIADPAVNLPFEDGAFDRYYSSFCLHLVSDPDKMLKEAVRVLQKNGTAAFSVWGRKENCVQFTYLNDIASAMGISLSPAAPTRSAFHLGVSAEALRQRAIQAGFSRAITFYQVTTKMLAPPSVAQAFNQLPPSQQAEVRARSDQFVSDRYQQGIPLPMEALILVASKD